MAGAIVVAPLAVGTVHRPSLLAIFVLIALALGALFHGLLRSGERMRLGRGTLLPAVFVFICAIQIIPLPGAVRDRIDPAGAELLNAGRVSKTHPLSLDPPSTRRELGKAAAVLAVFLLSYHFGSGRRAPRRMMHAVAAAGLVSLVVGLSHVAIGERSVYGWFKTGPTLLVLGPLINPNHTAELLELSAFTCASLAILARHRRVLWTWLAASAALAAGAVSTLSRGSILALAAGSFSLVVLWIAAEPGGDERRPLPWKRILLVGGVAAVVLAAALGAGTMLDELARTDLSRETKISVWQDSLAVIKAHPAGIGRGAFEYVYPAYENPQALRGSMAFVRYAFIENGALQLLIDTGWAGIALILIGSVFLVWELARSGIGRPEAALLAGTIAVLTHNLVDFGLEIAGVALPFSAVLGTALGRVRSQQTGSTRGALLMPSLALAGLVAGTLFMLSPSARDFDAALQRATSPLQRIELARQAQRAHPTDYFFVLAEAMAQPLRESGKSPRLSLLNRALRLCPGCQPVQTEVAVALWDLGMHDQALAHMRETIRQDASIDHPSLGAALTALNRRKAKPEEIAKLDTGSPRVRIELAGTLTDRQAFGLAQQLLSEVGSPDDRGESFLATSYRCQVAAGDLDRAAATLTTWQAQQPAAARLYIARADLARRRGDLDGAASIIESGATVNPGDFDLAVQRVAFGIERKRWAEAARAVEGLRRILLEKNRPVAEAYIWGARLAKAMGHSMQALSQYQAAAAQDRNNVTLWTELGQVARDAGQLDVATRAFTRVLELQPDGRVAREALEELHRYREAVKRSLIVTE